MNENLYPSDLTNEEWDCIKELIPAAKPGGCRRQLDMRPVLNTILAHVYSDCDCRFGRHIRWIKVELIRLALVIAS